MAAAIKFEMAAAQQHVAQLLAGALHARLCPRERDANALGELLLAQSLVFGHNQGLAVRLRQLVDQLAERERQQRLRVCVWQIGVGGQVFWDRHQLAPTTILIDDQVADDLVDPTFRPVPFGLRQATQVAMNANEDFLQNIFCIRIIPNSAADERSQPAAVLIPQTLKMLIHIGSG